MNEGKEELVRRTKRELDDVLAIVSEAYKVAQSSAFDAKIEARLVEIKSGLHRLRESLNFDDP
jgi:uncharacterized protein (UPF0335 family)